MKINAFPRLTKVLFFFVKIGTAFQSVQQGLIGISGVYLVRMIRDSQTPGDNVWILCLKPELLCCEESIMPLWRALDAKSSEICMDGWVDCDFFFFFFLI